MSETPRAEQATDPALPAEPAPQGDALPLGVDVVLLDMDGTLIDSGPAVERSWNTFFAAHGSDRTFDSSLHGVPARRTVQEVLPDLDAEQRAAAIDEIEDLEVSDVQGVVVLTGTERLLGELDRAAAELGRPTWAIVTSCTERLFSARWGATGLPRPEHLVTADQVEHGKPDPAPYRLGAERLGAPTAAALVIEDSIGGLTSGRAAGCATLAVTTTTAAGELRPLADALITSLDDIEARAEGGRLVISRRGA